MAFLKFILKIFCSLRLTVVLLGLGMLLIFLATLDQVNLGIFEVQKRYFRSWFALYSIPGIKLALPLPGGMLLGSLLLANLLAAHIVRFKWKWEKVGLIAIHLGIILLLLGELFTAILGREAQMVLNEGQSKTYSEAPRTVELAVIDRSGEDRSGEETEQVIAIPQSRLKDGAVFDVPELPFKIRINDFYRNAELGMLTPGEAPPDDLKMATQGIGRNVRIKELPHETAMDRRDLSSAFVEILPRDGEESKGTWLVSNAIPTPQTVEVDGKSWDLQIRQRRFYKPFKITLLDFSHDRYLGTDIPKNFSSLVKLDNPEEAEEREVLIYMNHPLRFGGYTFYQSGFDNEDTTSIFQVVRNPVWLLPYVACAMVGLGLLYVFLFHLVKFLDRRSDPRRTA